MIFLRYSTVEFSITLLYPLSKSSLNLEGLLEGLEDILNLEVRRDGIET